MSWSDPRFPLARIMTVVAVASAAAISACTVTPLYGNMTTGATPGQPGRSAASIALTPPVSREEQEVYNHMIFLLYGGAGEPANAKYSLRLGVIGREISTATLQTVIGGTNERQPTAGAIILSSHYTLTESGTGKVVASGKREISSSFDVSKQEFAADRAARDAQNRAARELAELLRMAVLQDMKSAGL